MTKKLVLILALAPSLAFAQPATPAPGARSDPARIEQMQKRMRVAQAIGLADALDLDDAAALKLRAVMVKYDAQRAPLRKQAVEAMRTIRDAARGDKKAVGQVDQAVQNLAQVRSQLEGLNVQQYKEVTQGLSGEKKAKAAIFLTQFRGRAARMGWHRSDVGPGPGAMGPMGPGNRGPGMRGAGRGMGPGMGMGQGAGPGSEGCVFGMVGPGGPMGDDGFDGVVDDL